MKDRLIELIKEAKKHTKNANSDIERNMIFADYLLENGVIVPPCKVGDTVYLVTLNGNIRELFITDIHIQINTSGVYTNISAMYFVDKCTYFIQVLPDSIGEKVFLTREEAVAKLKEGADDDL